MKLRPTTGAPGRNVAFVQNVAVDESHRRRGHGTALVEFCEAAATRRWHQKGVGEALPRTVETFDAHGADTEKGIR